MPRALMELHWLPVDKRMYEPMRVLRSAESNLPTVPPGKPGKYGSRSFVRSSANLWYSLRGERVVWLKNSPTVERFKINLKRTSSVNGSGVRQCYLFLLMYIIVLCLFYCMLLYVY